MSGARHDLFEEGSDANNSALEMLAEALRDIGFRVRKKSPIEHTLRVYPRKYGQYPLLNPRFMADAVHINPAWNKEGVVVSVLSKGQEASIDTLLSSFRSETCVFSADNAQGQYRYRYHGAFFIPLCFEGEKGNEVIDLAALSQSFVEIHRRLGAAQ